MTHTVLERVRDATQAKVARDVLWARHRVGDLVKVDADKSEMLVAFFASAFIRKFFQVFVPRDRVQEEEDLSNGSGRSIKVYLVRS